MSTGPPASGSSASGGSAVGRNAAGRNASSRAGAGGGPAVRRLNEPVPTRVWLDGVDRPERVEWRDRVQDVEVVLDTWCVDDAWWSDRPVSRIYHEVQLVTGVRLVLSWDMVAGRWLAQR